MYQFFLESIGLKVANLIAPLSFGTNFMVPNKRQITISDHTLLWRHYGRDGVSNHQSHDCLVNRLFRHISQKTPKLRVTGLCAGIHGWPVDSPRKCPVTRKMFPFDDVIMKLRALPDACYNPILHDYCPSYRQSFCWWVLRGTDGHLQHAMF